MALRPPPGGTLLPDAPWLLAGEKDYAVYVSHCHDAYYCYDSELDRHIRGVLVYVLQTVEDERNDLECNVCNRVQKDHAYL
jgi:hypothetical protein